MSARLSMLGSLTLVAVMASMAAAQALPVPPGLDVSLPAAKRLAGAREFIAAQDWNAAIAALEQLSAEFGGALIEVEPGRYLNVEQTVAVTLARLPEAGLVAYRRRADPAQELLFREARDRHSPDLMRQVVRDGFATSVGDDALNWLAEHALETGDIDTARRCWTALLPLPAAQSSALVLRFPDPRLPPDEVAARLVLCSLLQGDHSRAQHELAVFTARYGDAEGQLAGRTGRLDESLSALLAESRMWSPPALARESGSSSSPMLHGSAVDVAAILWTQALLPPASVGSARDEFAGLTSPSVQTAVWNDALIVPGAYAVRALNLVDGTPRWPSGAADDRGTLYADPPPENARDHRAPPLVQHSCQVVEGRCYVRLAAPVLDASSASPSRLACLDLSAEGRLSWIAGSDEFAEFPEGRFSGPPLVSGDRVFVPVRWGSPQAEIGIACLDAVTGDLRWHRRICTALDTDPATERRGDQDALGAATGAVSLLSSTGLLAACDAATGELQWAATCATAGIRNGSAAAPLPGAVVCHGGRVFARPRDLHGVLAFAADDGRRLWSLELPSRVHDLLGVVEGRLIASGDHLWGVDVDTGRAWRFGFDDPEGFGFGRGAIACGRIYWTTHDELFVIDATDGLLVDRVLFDPATGITGGNVTVTGRSLVLAGPSRLTVFGPAPGPE